MRKRLIARAGEIDSTRAHGWLDLEHAALVEVSSESDEYPIEGALLPHLGRGWRASTAGTQIIRLLFDEPQTVHTIRLVFKEEREARTQEFLLRWLPRAMGSWKEVVRQQWNFSPPDTVEEREEYKVNLASVAALELTINPDMSQQGMRASLEELRLAVGEHILDFPKGVILRNRSNT
jgi:hypothetical protein